MFFKNLQYLSAKYDKTFIVDEVQTGLGTGKPWAHTGWGLDVPPDMVVFSKKMQTSGYFATPDYRPDEWQIFNTYCGDSLRVLQLEAILDTIDEDDLFTQSKAIGLQLVAELEQLPTNVVYNVRGDGLLIAFDTPDPGRLLSTMQDHHILASTCGTQSIRLRPSLVFDKPDVAVFIDRMTQAIRGLED